MRYCIFCGIQVSDGVRGNSRLMPSLHNAFGRRALKMVIPVAESAMPDEEEHMAFAHGFVPISQSVVNGKVVEQGPWACVSENYGYTFGEQWERVNAREGRKVA